MRKILIVAYFVDQTKLSFRKINVLETLKLMPVISIILLFSLLATLLWIINIKEQEQTKLDLISDTLWVEQTLQFQLSNDLESFSRLAIESRRNETDPRKFELHSRQILTTDPAIAAVFWIYSDGKIKSARLQNGLTLTDKMTADILSLSAELKENINSKESFFTKPFKFGADTAFGQAAFVSGKETNNEMLLSVISFDRMLQRNIPWWIAEKRAVEVRDHGGELLASRARTPEGSQLQSHTIAFGSQPEGLFLTLFAMRSPTNLTRDGLVGAIIVMGVLAGGGLLARENHLRKRRFAEDELKKEHAFRKAMEDALTVGMRARDLKGQIIYVNQAFCKMMGCSNEELVGHKPPMPYWAPEEMEKTKLFHENVLAGSPPTDGVELVFKRKNGTPFTALVYEAPLIGLDGRQTGWMGSFLDVTERKLAEELAKKQADQIQNTARLVLIGEMASILAHDLNQPLATISSYQAGLMNHLSDDTISREDILATLEKVGEAAERAGLIVHRVQDFVKRNEPSLEKSDLREIILHTVDIFQRDSRFLASKINVNANRQPFIVNCDVVLIEQVIINLLRNADESMANLQLRKRIIDVHIERIANEIEVRIMDHGSGIPEDMVGDIFRPFVSTKPGGMGLGLTICRSVLEAHQSRLTGSTCITGGAVFSFKLKAI